MKRVYYIFLLLLSLSITCCNTFELFDDDNIGETEQTAEVDHTMIFYVMGDINISNSLAENVKQIAQSVDGDFAENGQIVIYYDRRDSTTLLRLRANNIKENKWRERFEVLKRYEKQNCASEEVLRTVMNDVQALAPSKSYGIVFSGHGGGWFPNHVSSGTTNDDQKVAAQSIEHPISIDPNHTPLTRWYGYDNNSSVAENFMTTEIMVSGLSVIDLNYIIFDACYMSSIELLYALRNSADYIVASPAEIMAYGFPYSEIIPMIFEDGGSLIDISEQFVDYYQHRYERTFKCGAIAVIDCSELDNLALSVKAIYDAGVADFDIKKVQPLESLYTDHAYFDMMSYISLAAPSPELFNGFVEAFEKAVVYSNHTTSIYAELGSYPKGTGRAGYVSSVSPDGVLSLCGLNCYIPREHLPVTKSYWEQTEWGKRVLSK